jgi:ubiquinone/menaquinone biosynthesis C-methylase UbiE
LEIGLTKFTDQQYLKNDQYKDSSNLDARALIHQRFSTNRYGWFKWVFEPLLKLPENASILELGCGHGLLWKENADRIPPKWNITLSDLSPGMLDAAWRNLVVTGRAFQFREIDAQEIPFEDEKFDAVIANFMLYHVSDRSKALHEIKRILKPGGRLIAATVGNNHMREVTDWTQRVNKESQFPFSVSFTLENGLDQLSSVFSRAELIRYPDSLQVTEVKPLVAYILSNLSAGELVDSELRNVEVELGKELKTRGAIHITKDIGLFKAIK